jgi:uncharacterized protein
MRPLLAELGLAKLPSLHRDPQFAAALFAGLAFWIALALFARSATPRAPAPLTVMLSLTLWQPLLEEFLFRGVVQGELKRFSFGKRAALGITGANALTSVVFTALHFLQHSPLWAAATLLPSLAFGYFRDRHDSLYPPVLLHIYYNTGYFLTAGFPT